MKALLSLPSPRCLPALRTAAWLGLGALSAPVWAQPVIVPPAAQAGTLQQRQIDEDRRRREEERLRPAAPDPLNRPAAPALAPLAPEAGALRFDVREIRFTPSAILAPADLEAIAAQYRGRHISLAELQALAAQVNALYQQQGVVTATATIGPQDISSGLVEVTLVEGRVGAVDISGHLTTRESYIQSRLGLTAGEIVDLNQLEERLVWFNRTNDVRLEADLQPGNAFGHTDILIKAVEPDKHQVLATFDNLGSPMTGRWRAGMSYRNRSLLGWRDNLSLAYTYARGQKSASAGYDLPINRWGGRVDYTYYDDATAVRFGALSSLNITGRSESHVLSLRQPVHVSNDLQVDLTAAAKKRESRNYFDGVQLQSTDSTDGSVGIDVLGSSDKSLWGWSVTRIHGHATAANNRLPFKLTKGQLRYSRDIAEGWSLRTNAHWQYAGNSSLASSEQFLLGGEGSVRGYDIAAYSGDQGATASVELHHAIGMWPLGGKEFATTGFLFVDHGRLKQASTQGEGAHLTGLGYGVNASLGKQTSLRMTLARGIDQLPQNGRRSVVLSMQLVHSLY